MDRKKIEIALEKLKELGYIVACDYTYRFTEQGHNYTEQTSGDAWVWITKSNNSSLWVRRNLRYKGSWTFVPVERVTEEQFEDFCKYYNITIEEPKKLVICDEVEFMDI